MKGKKLLALQITMLVAICATLLDMRASFIAFWPASLALLMGLHCHIFAPFPPFAIQYFLMATASLGQIERSMATSTKHVSSN